MAWARNGLGTKWDRHEMGQEGTKWDGHEMGRARNGIGTNWAFFEIFNISRARFRMGTKWDGHEMGQ